MTKERPPFQTAFEELNAVSGCFDESSLPTSPSERDFRRHLLVLCAEITENARQEGILDPEYIVVREDY